MDQADVTAPGSRLLELLRASTVMLEIQKPDVGTRTLGTGFFVAPGVVATCAHVLADPGETPPVRVAGRLIAQGIDLQLATTPEDFCRDISTGLDLALLAVASAGGDKAPYVLLSGMVEVGDEMWTFGHPDSMFRAGQHASFIYQGPSRRGEKGIDLLRAWGTPVSGGFSGSPVLNLRTGAVCGMLSTSDKAGSAHLISTDEILARCRPARIIAGSSAAHRGWLEALTDSQLAHGRWRFPTRQLRAYLAATARAARDHPYPGVLYGSSPPPLSAVYVQQKIQTPVPQLMQGPRDPAQPGRSARNPAETRLPAEIILEAEIDSVVIGGPGAGKSSLLRTGLISLTERWNRNEDCQVVPVRVLAADLTGKAPFPEEIANGVRADLSSAGLLDDWGPEFFHDPPLPGVRWLVLIDGLDEITDPVRRRTVLNMLAGVRESDPEGRYCFVITTRPLPDLELAGVVLGRNVLRYELLPFSGDQLPGFAEGWFTALGLLEPHLAADRFMAQVGRTRLAELARTPLMATLMCQLFAANPERPLPTGRYGLYQAFTELIRERQYSSTSGGVIAQVRASLSRYGTDAANAAETLPGRVFVLLRRLALDRIDGGTESAVDLMTGWTANLRPDQVGEQAWQLLVRESLRRSGLLTEHAGDFVFLHHTVTEFLAAWHVAVNDPERSASEFRRLFDPRDGQPPPHEDSRSSYTRFLIAAWNTTSDRARLTQALKKMTSAERIDGCAFIAELANDGIPLNPAITKMVGATLAHLAGNRELSGASQVLAARLLVTLGGSRGARTLADLAASPALSAQYRIEAARMLMSLEDPRAANRLDTLLADSKLSDRSRIEAARLLMTLDHQRAVNRLAALAADRNSHVYFQIKLAKELAGLGDPRGAEVLFGIANTGGTAYMDYRAIAAQELVRLNDPRGIGILVRMATSPGRSYGGERTLAARALATLGDPRATEALAVIARHAGLPRDDRAQAALALYERGDPRSTELLAALAADSSLGTNDGLEMAKKLCELGDIRGIELLMMLATHPGNYGFWPEIRVGAARALADRGDGRGIEMLASLCASTDLYVRYRAEAAQALVALGDQRGIEFLAALAVDSIPLAEALARAGDRRGTEILMERASRPADDGSYHYRNMPPGLIHSDRYDAVRSLGRLGHPRHREFLAAVVSDLTCATWYRIKAAQALVGLGESGHKKALGALDALARDPDVHSYYRVRAARALAHLDMKRGNGNLAVLASSTETPDRDRVRAAWALGALGDPRGFEILEALTAKLTSSRSVRHAAAHALHRLR